VLRRRARKSARVYSVLMMQRKKRGPCLRIAYRIRDTKSADIDNEKSHKKGGGGVTGKTKDCSRGGSNNRGHHCYQYRQGSREASGVPPHKTGKRGEGVPGARDHSLECERG